MNPLDIRALRLGLKPPKPGSACGSASTPPASAAGNEAAIARAPATSIACANCSNTRRAKRAARWRLIRAAPSGNCVGSWAGKTQRGKTQRGKTQCGEAQCGETQRAEAQHGAANHHDSRSPLHPRDIGPSVEHGDRWELITAISSDVVPTCRPSTSTR